MPLPDDYEFYCPVKTCSGNKALENLPFELELLGARKPLIVTNEEIVGDRRVKHIIRAFKDSRMPIGLFNNVPYQADLKAVHHVAEIYREKNCDALIAVGAGSVFEIAKAVNLAVSVEADDLKQFTEEESIKRPLKPFAAVLNSLGTGFEITKSAAIEGMTFSSHFLMPNLVVIDPRMVTAENIQATIITAITALTHAVEAYTCLAKNPLSDMYAYTAIQLISENLVNIIKSPNDKNGRVALVNAVSMAGCAFSTSPVSLIHKLGQAVHNTCRLSLGICMGILLPPILEYNTYKKGYHTSGLLLPLAGFEGYAAIPEAQKAQQAIEAIRTLLTDMYVAVGGFPLTLQVAKVSKGKLEDIVQAVSNESPEEVDTDDCLMILEHAWEGKPVSSA
jgi:alcohol dehydrogenase